MSDTYSNSNNRKYSMVSIPGHIKSAFLLIVSLIVSCTGDVKIEPREQFIKFYAEAEAVGFLRDGDDFVLIGRGSNNSFISKIDENGILKWEKNIPGFEVQDLIENTGSFPGKYVIVGHSAIVGANDINVVFLLENGVNATFKVPNLETLESSRCTSEFTASRILIDPSDGGVLVLGVSDDCTGLKKPFILKIIDFSTVWIEELGSEDPLNNISVVKSIVLDGSEILLIYNVSSSPGGNANNFIRIAGFNLQTRQETSLSIIADGNNIIAGDIIATDNGYAVIGTDKTFSNNPRRLFFKLDQNGQLVEDSFRRGINSSEGSSLFQTMDRGFITGGTVKTFTQEDFLIMKMNDSGNPDWKDPVILGGEETNEFGAMVYELENGAIMVFGTSEIFGKPRMTIIKTNSSGMLYNRDL